MVVKEEKRAKALLPLPTTSTVSEIPLPKPRLRTLVKDKTASKKVSFMDVTAPENQETENVSYPSSLPGTEKREVSKLPPITKVVTGSEVAPIPPQSTTEEEDDEEESYFSEGQVIAASSQSTSDESDISEEILEQMEDVEEAPVVEYEEQSESILSDSDDCIVSWPVLHGTEAFCAYATVPVQNPHRARPATTNYSNVIHVDIENNKTRREILRGVLEGRNPQMENIRFTVVSEPPEEEEQEKECEDVGVAFFRIPDILEQQQDLIETSLNIVDVQDSSVVVGSLCVSVEGLDGHYSLSWRTPDHDYTPLSSLEQKAEG
ncbi:hypothetical protein J4Q44_G00090180 [Coregonus suidteri]|uniref:RPGRIP1 C-terminal domain-containing protein n=1 Tax=Coregonus suidteri TaxID=861788 RepID=A0AAN8R0T1_9TELE